MGIRPRGPEGAALAQSTRGFSGQTSAALLFTHSP
eukprot:CAMPEP_0174905210 /NCGR_PEP_ID=MMETSP0167-20121228/52125_1 /TAXON_ID=38298 /ORGANISM="Rhodella maculata, Strain CCMP736" /LENGTH=34 /DNA_ID= /DNA_START= /DNA_END= /DNA_ORIENTATION=